MTVELSDAGEYCVTGTSGDDEAVDACYQLNTEDIAESGSTIPAEGTLGLIALSVLIAIAGMHMLRRNQVA